MAVSFAKKALKEAANHRKQLALNGGFVSAVLGGFGVIYQHTNNEYLLLGMWICGILLCVLLGAFLLTLAYQREQDVDNPQ